MTATRTTGRGCGRCRVRVAKSNEALTLSKRMASFRSPEQNRPMDPVTLTTDRLLLRTVGPHDTDAVYDAVQDPDIQRWTTIPSPYLREHAAGFTDQMVPDGWADGSMFTFGVFVPSGELVGMLAITMRSWAPARSASGRRRNTAATATSPRPRSPRPAGPSPTSPSTGWNGAPR